MSLAMSESNPQDWETLLKEFNHIENITKNTTVLEFRQGCSVMEEFHKASALVGIDGASVGED